MHKDTIQLWECPSCHHRLEAPIPYAEVLCPNRHLDARKRRIVQRLKVVWERSSGQPVPPRVLEPA